MKNLIESDLINLGFVKRSAIYDKFYVFSKNIENTNIRVNIKNGNLVELYNIDTNALQGTLTVTTIEQLNLYLNFIKEAFKL